MPTVRPALCRFQITLVSERSSMRWVWGLIRGILVLFRLFLAGVAFTAGAGGLYGLLFMFFFAVGLVLVLFGFDLDKVDIWLDAHADWFEAAGTFLIKALL